MKVVLVQPRGFNWVPGQRDLSTVVNRLAPIGLLSLAAVLERDGHEVSVHDALGPGVPESGDRNIDAIASLRPDLVGFTSTTSSFLDGAAMARRIKDRLPSAITVAGGVLVSSMGPSLLERHDGVDLLVFGEGELTLREIASGAPLGSIAGLAFRDGGHVAATPPRTPIENLDELPFPAYRLLSGFPRGYHLPLFNAPGAPGAGLITSRGCPYRCSFCDRSVFGPGYRFHSAGYVHTHMAQLVRDFGVRHVNIYDDLFTFDRPRVVALCESLIRQPLGLTFNCAVRVGHLDAGLLPLLKKAGAWMISLGIETGDPDLLRRHKPGVKIEQVRETVARIHEAGLLAKGLFMAGLPGETPETLARTTEFLLSLDLDDMNLSRFTPFHGAPVWNGIRDEGAIEEDWRRMNCNNFVFLPRAFDSMERLEAGYVRAVKSFYTSRAWRKRWLKRAWVCRHSLYVLLRHLPAMLKALSRFESALKATPGEGAPRGESRPSRIMSFARVRKRLPGAPARSRRARAPNGTNRGSPPSS